MSSVDLAYTFFHGDRTYAREMCVWTRETNFQYYPLSYSLRDCFELICESLGWEYEQYETLGCDNGIIYAMEPEPPEPPKVSMMEYWNGTTFTDGTITDGSMFLTYSAWIHNVRDTEIL